MDVNDFYLRDPRRQSSLEVTYGEEWRDDSDPLCLFTLRWVEETHEIYLMRKPQLPADATAFPHSASAGTPWMSTRAVRIEVLGWAKDRDVLDGVLQGWESRMQAVNSVLWIRGRLGRAAAATEWKAFG